MQLTYTNIFEVVTNTKALSRQYRMRSDLMIYFKELIQRQGWSQKVAAQQIGTTQQTVNEIVNGKIEKLSFELLIACYENVESRFNKAFNGCNDTVLLAKIDKDKR